MPRCLGTTQERTTCDRCGKVDLKATVAFEFDHGGIEYYGVDCAARVLRTPEAEVRKAARKADTEKHEAELAKKSAEHATRVKPWFDFLKAKTGHTEVMAAIQSLGGYAKAKEAFKAEGGTW